MNTNIEINMNIQTEIIEYVEVHPLTDGEKINLIGLCFELIELIDKWDGAKKSTIKNLFPEERRNSIPSGDFYGLGKHVSNLVKLNILPIKHQGKLGNTHLYTKIY